MDSGPAAERLKGRPSTPMLRPSRLASPSIRSGRRDRSILIALHIAELHDLVSVARQLAPAAGLAWILLDGLVVAAIHLKAQRLQTGTGACSTQGLAGDYDLGAASELCGNRLQKLCV